MSERAKAGRVRVQLYGKSYVGTWQVGDGLIEVRSDLGTESVRLGGMASAPAVVAAEKLREMVLKANRKVVPKTSKDRFNIRDA